MYCFICFYSRCILGFNLAIPIAVIIQSSYVLYELIKNKTLILENAEE